MMPPLEQLQLTNDKACGRSSPHCMPVPVSYLLSGSHGLEKQLMCNCLVTALIQ